MHRPLIRLLWISVIATITTSGLYFYRFWFKAGFPGLSNDPAVWGQYGDYIGGTLGTLFACLAFLGIALTLLFQHRQGELQEVQRLLASAASTVDGILDTFEHIDNKDTRQFLFLVKVNGCRVRELIAGMGANALQASPIQYPDEIVERLRYVSNWLVIELQQLTLCLEHYRDRDGSDFIIKFYTQRYRAYVCWLHALKMLNSSVVIGYFDPDGFMQFMRPAASDSRK